MSEQTVQTQHAAPEACATCPAFNAGHLTRLGIDTGNVDHVLALAGNPNTGKSTVFNALTGLRQHTGNWPGKTVTRAEGAFAYADKRYRIVDLPGHVLAALHEQPMKRSHAISSSSASPMSRSSSSMARGSNGI